MYIFSGNDDKYMRIELTARSRCHTYSYMACLCSSSTRQYISACGSTITIERDIALLPSQVWDAITDPHRWYIPPSGFRPIVGQRFRVAHLPLLGTGYTGLHEGVVTHSRPSEELGLAMSTLRQTASPTRWNISVVLRLYRDRTRVTVTLRGLDPADQQQRALSYILKEIIAGHLHTCADT